MRRRGKELIVALSVFFYKNCTVRVVMRTSFAAFGVDWKEGAAAQTRERERERARERERESLPLDWDPSYHTQINDH